MNKIWADRVIAGTRTFGEVPASRKEAVKAIIKEKVSPERYSELVGE